MYKLNIKVVVFLWLLAWVGPNVSAQTKEEKTLVKQADKFFKNREFSKAFPLFSQLVGANAKNPEYNYKYGACIIHASQKKSDALSYLDFAVKNTPGITEAHFYLGRAYHVSYEFDQAIKLYQTFKTSVKPKVADDYRLDLLISECERSQELIKDFKQIKVLSSKKLKETQFFRGYKLGKLNRKILLKPDEFKTKEDQEAKSKELNLVVYGSDQNTLIFSAHKKNTAGKYHKDLFMVTRDEEGSWGSFQALGSNINTDLDEAYPYLHPNGTTLYFSSKGHGGLGGYDIYKTELDYDEWSTPVNVGFSINSPFDDIMYVVDQNDKVAYFASNRQNGTGNITVYKIIPPQNNDHFVLVKGDVTIEGEKSRKSTITIINTKTGAFVGKYKSDRKSGQFVFPLAENESYELQFKFLDTLNSSIKLVMPSKAEKDIVYQAVVLGVERAAQVRENLAYMASKKDRNDLIKKLAFLNKNQVDDVKFSSEVPLDPSVQEKKRTAEPSEITVSDAAALEEIYEQVIEQPEDNSAKLLENASANLAKLQDENDWLSKKIAASYRIANQKNKEAIRLKNELSDDTKPLQELPQDSKKKALQGKATEVKIAVDEASYALSYAQELELDLKLKKKEQALSKSYVDALNLTLKGSSSSESIAALENYQQQSADAKKDLLRKKRVSLFEQVKTKQVQLANEQKSAAAVVNDLKNDLNLMNQETALLEEQISDTRKKSIKEELGLQVEELKTDKLQKLYDLEQNKQSLAQIKLKAKENEQKLAIHAAINAEATEITEDMVAANKSGKGTGDLNYDPTNASISGVNNKAEKTKDVGKVGERGGEQSDYKLGGEWSMSTEQKESLIASVKKKSASIPDFIDQQLPVSPADKQNMEKTDLVEVDQIEDPSIEFTQNDQTDNEVTKVDGNQIGAINQDLTEKEQSGSASRKTQKDDQVSDGIAGQGAQSSENKVGQNELQGEQMSLEASDNQILDENVGQNTTEVAQSVNSSANKEGEGIPLIKDIKGDYEGNSSGGKGDDSSGTLTQTVMDLNKDVPDNLSDGKVALSIDAKGSKLVSQASDKSDDLYGDKSSTQNTSQNTSQTPKKAGDEGNGQMTGKGKVNVDDNDDKLDQELSQKLSVASAKVDKDMITGESGDAFQADVQALKENQAQEADMKTNETVANAEVSSDDTEKNDGEVQVGAQSDTQLNTKLNTKRDTEPNVQADVQVGDKANNQIDGEDDSQTDKLDDGQDKKSSIARLSTDDDDATTFDAKESDFGQTHLNQELSVQLLATDLNTINDQQVQKLGQDVFEFPPVLALEGISSKARGEEQASLLVVQEALIIQKLIEEKKKTFKNPTTDAERKSLSSEIYNLETQVHELKADAASKREFANANRYKQRKEDLELEVFLEPKLNTPEIQGKNDEIASLWEEAALLQKVKEGTSFAADKDSLQIQQLLVETEALSKQLELEKMILDEKKVITPSFANDETSNSANDFVESNKADNIQLGEQNTSSLNQKESGVEVGLVKAKSDNLVGLNEEDDKQGKESVDAPLNSEEMPQEIIAGQDKVSIKSPGSESNEQSSQNKEGQQTQSAASKNNVGLSEQNESLAVDDKKNVALSVTPSSSPSSSSPSSSSSSESTASSVMPQSNTISSSASPSIASSSETVLDVTSDVTSDVASGATPGASSGSKPSLNDAKVPGTDVKESKEETANSDQGQAFKKSISGEDGLINNDDFLKSQPPVLTDIDQPTSSQKGGAVRGSNDKSNQTITGDQSELGEPLNYSSDEKELALLDNEDREKKLKSIRSDYAKNSESLKLRANQSADPYEQATLSQQARLYEVASDEQKVNQLSTQANEVFNAYHKNQEALVQAKSKMNKNSRAADAFELEQKSAALYVKAQERFEQANQTLDPLQRVNKVNEAREIAAYASLKQNEAIKKYQSSIEKSKDRKFRKNNFELDESIVTQIANNKKALQAQQINTGYQKQTVVRKKAAAESSQEQLVSAEKNASDTSISKENNQNFKEDATDNLNDKSALQASTQVKDPVNALDSASSSNAASAQAVSLQSSSVQSSSLQSSSPQSSSSELAAQGVDVNKSKTTDAQKNKIANQKDPQVKNTSNLDQKDYLNNKAEGRDTQEQAFDQTSKSDFLSAYERLIKEAQAMEYAESQRQYQIDQLKREAEQNKVKSEQALKELSSFSTSSSNVSNSKKNSKLQEVEAYRGQAETKEVQAKKEEFYMSNNLAEARSKRKEASLILEVISQREQDNLFVSGKGSQSDPSQPKNIQYPTYSYEESRGTYSPNTMAAKKGLKIITTARYNSRTVIPVDVSLPSGLVYKVQVGAFRKKINPAIFNGITPLTGEKTGNGIVRYTAGLFKSFQAADMAKGRIRNLGYSDAFVVAFFDGRRISMEGADDKRNNSSDREKQEYVENKEKEIKALKKLGITESEAKSLGGRRPNPVDNFSARRSITSFSNVQASSVPAREKSNKNSSTYYTVQVGVYSSAKTSAELKGVGPLKTEKLSNGLIRYTTGTFANLNEANDRRDQVRAAGIPDAYVVSFKKGQRSASSQASSSRSNFNGSVTSTRANQGLLFKVQIAAYKTKVSIAGDPMLNQLSSFGVDFTATSSGLFLYTAGSFILKKEADELRNELINLGISDAFVVAFNGGKKISIAQADKIAAQR